MHKHITEIPEGREALTWEYECTLAALTCVVIILCRRGRGMQRSREIEECKSYRVESMSVYIERVQCVVCVASIPHACVHGQ